MMLRELTFGLLGLVVCVALAGCGAGTKKENADQGTKEAAHKKDAEHGHEHAASGPHGGHMIALGNDQFQAEMLQDEPSHTVTVHLLDAAGKQAVTSDQPTLTIQLFQEGKFLDYQLAAVRAGGAAGASEFKVVDEKLCDYLLHAKEVKGRLKVTIAGQPLVGTLEHQAHGHDAEDDGGDHAGHDHE